MVAPRHWIKTCVLCKLGVGGMAWQSCPTQRRFSERVDFRIFAQHVGFLYVCPPKKSRTKKKKRRHRPERLFSATAVYRVPDEVSPSAPKGTVVSRVGRKARCLTAVRHMQAASRMGVFIGCTIIYSGGQQYTVAARPPSTHTRNINTDLVVRSGHNACDETHHQSLRQARGAISTALDTASVNVS